MVIAQYQRSVSSVHVCMCLCCHHVISWSTRIMIIIHSIKTPKCRKQNVIRPRQHRRSSTDRQAS
ncbi:unnamed protein product, partial [Dicrocoelium dendriticum]